MSNLLNIKGSRVKIYKTLPSNTVGNDGDIILSQIQGRGVYLCSKVNGKWHVSSKMEELRKIENTSTKDLTTNKLQVLDNLAIGRGTTTITKDEAKFSSSLKIKEASNAISDTVAYGQLWVKTATPNELYFTTDAGNDIQLTSGTTAAFVGDITSVVAGDGLTGGGTTGDVTLTVSVDDSTIETNSDALRIKDDGVTYAKIQNVSATDRILGRDSSGAGVIEEITPANLRTMINVADGATASAGTITGVTAGDGLSGGGSSGGVSLAVNVDDSTIETNSDTLRLKDSGVTLAKMANIADDRLLGRYDEGDAGAPIALTASSVRALLNVADGATANTGDITGVTAGTNCSGGGSSGSVTINVDDAFLINSGDDTTSGTITAGGFTTTGTWTFDDATSGTVGVTTVHTGSSFTDNDTSLMTAGAIKEKIESYGYTTADGDITSVRFVTDSGSGSAAEDTADTANFSLLGSSGVGITNSGTTITAVAVPGEIDHDSLNNFVANEHIDWTGASAGTIHASNYTDTNTNQLTTFVVEDGDGTEVTISQDKEWKFVEGTGIDIDWTDTSNGSDADPYDLTITCDLEGTELKSTGETGGNKYLREDGDGTCSWQTVSASGNFLADNADDTMAGTLTIDKDSTGTTTATTKALVVDFDQTGIAASGQTVTSQGLVISVNDNSVTHVGTHSVTGITNNVISNNSGTSTATGILNNLTHPGGDVADTSIGIQQTVPDGGVDIKLQSSANVSDYFQIATGTNGATTITTVEDGGDSNADLSFAIDGSVNFDVVGTVEFDGCGVGFDLVTPTYNASDTNVDFLTGNKQFVTFGSGNITDLNLIFPKTSGNFTLLLKQDGTGSRTVTNYKVWDRVDSSAASGSATVLFAGGSNPTLTTAANKTDIISFFYDADNEIAYGVASLNF